MAYLGYLLKINETTVPLKYMQHKSCKIKVNTQDLDSFQDSRGVLNRTVLEHTEVKIEWNFQHSTNHFLQELLTIFREAWGEGPERKATCTVYIPEWDRYYTGTFYMPDPEFQIYSADADTIEYDPVRFALIEY